MPYDFRINGQMSLETRQAYQAGLQLNQDLNRLMSETSINLNTDNLISANKQVLELQSNLRAALNPTRGTIDLAMLSQQLDRSGTSLTQYAANLSKYGKDGQQAFLSLTKQIAAAEAPTTRLSQGIKDMGEQFKRTVGWQISSSAIHGIMSTYHQAIGYAKELNRSLTDIRIVTGQSQAQMANFAKQANIAAKNLSSTTTRYTDAALIYYQQGLSDKAVKERADVTIKMANVAGISAEKASQQLTAIWNNFDNGSKSLEHYADVLVKLGAETASSSDEISKGVQKFAAIGNTVGLSYEYAASALATVTATTRESADTVGTSFRTLFSRLQGLSLGETLEDGTTLNKYSKALDTVGVRIKETNGDMKSMNDILDELGTKWKTLGKDTQIGLAQSIGGARQYATFMALMDNWDYFQENVNRANNAAGALQKQQDIYAESWTAASKQVQASMEGIFDSVINDKFVIGATKSFATVLESVQGLTEGFGGLGGMVSTVMRFGLNKYAKEIPRMWDDLKYNIGYMVNPKTGTIDKRQQSMFSQAYESIGSLASQNKMVGSSIARNEKGQIVGMDWGEALGTDVVFGTELKNAAFALDRRQQYLAVEKTLSEREKQQYQQAMQIAAMWDQRAIFQAQQVKASSDMLNATREDIAKENYGILTDTSGKYSKRYRTIGEDGKSQINQYDLRREEERDAYFTARAQDLKNRRVREEEAVRKNSEYWIDKKSTSSKPVLTAEGKALIKSINKSYEERLVGLQTEKAGIVDQIKGSIIQELDPNSKYIQSAFSSKDASGKTVFNEQAMNNFNAVLKEVNAGNKITATQRQILQEGFEAIQKPLVDATGSFGKLSYHTNKLTDNINKNNTAVMSSAEVQSKFKDSQSNITRTWNEFTKNASKAGVLMTQDENGKKIISSEYKEAKTAYSNLQKALSGSASEAEIHRLTKEFELKATAITDKVERAAWERGLTDDQTSQIRQRAEANDRSFEAQKEIEFKQQQQQNIQIQHQQQAIERFAQTGQTLMAVYSAYQGMQGAMNTLSDENASASQKFGAILGASANTAILASQAAKSKTLVKAGSKLGTWFVGTKAGGAVTGALATGVTKAGAAATAAGATKIGGALAAGGAKLAGVAGGSAAIPGIGPAIAIVLGAIALAPKLLEMGDAAVETSKEREQRLTKEYTTLEQLAQASKEKQALYEQSRSSYLASIEKFYTTELGSLDNLKALSEANEQAISLIQKGNLNVSDYEFTDTGLIEINHDVLEEAENKLIKQAAADSAKNTIAHTRDLIENRKIDREYFQTSARSEESANIKIEDYQKKINKGETLTEKEQENYEELIQAKTQKELDNAKILSSFNSSLLAAAQSDGTFSKDDKSAITSLIGTISVDQLQEIQQQLDKDFDKKAYFWSEKDIKTNAIKRGVMSEDEINAIIESDEYKELRKQDKQQARQYLMDAVKNQAYLNQYNNMIEKAKEDERKLSENYNREAIEGQTMEALEKMITDGGELYKGRNNYGADGLGEEYKFVLAQYNQIATDFYKAVGEYLPDVDFANALQGFTLEQAEILSASIQEVGEAFGNDAAKAIYNAATNTGLTDSEKERFYEGLDNLDLSGSKINSLNNIKELTKGLGKSFDKTFNDIFKSFGGDAGLFTELTKDGTIQKMVDNFTKLGDIDANSIVQAANSSKDLAMALELGNFNSGGLAAALQSIASGTIEVSQVTSGLLAGLSHLKQGETIQAEAFAAVDGYDKGRSVTDLSKFYSNLSKTIEFDLTKGIVFDEPLMNAWEQVFGTESKNQLHQDFMAWKAEGANLGTKFNDKYKREKEYLEQAQKNPGTQAPAWDYAFDSTKMDKNDNSRVYSKGNSNYQYQSVSNADVEWATKIINQSNNSRLPEASKPSASQVEAANAILAKSREETDITSKYTNINGRIYEVTQDPNGEVGKIGWDSEKGQWTSYKYDENGQIVKTGNINERDYVYGWNTQKKTLDFNKDQGRQFSGTVDEFQAINKYVLGMSDGMNDTATADILAHSGVMQQAMNGQSGLEIAEAIGTMTKTSIENGEFITKEALEAIYQNSSYLQSQYTAGPEKFIADLVKSNDQYNTAFNERYLDFSGADMSGSFNDIDEQLTKNTGIGTLERIDDLAQTRKIFRKNKDAVLQEAKEGGPLFGWGKKDEVRGESWDIDKGAKWTDMQAYDYGDTMERLLSMGYSQSQANEAMTELLQKDDGTTALIAEVRGIGGNLITYSTESKAYQDWAKNQGIEDAENNAEAFGNFISEQDKVAQAVDAMRIQAEAKAKYEEMYNPDGSLKEDAKAQLEEDGGVAPQTKEQKEQDKQKTGNGEGESVVTDAVYTPPPSSGGNSEGGGGGNPNAGKIAVTTSTTASDGKTYTITEYMTPEEYEEKINGGGSTPPGKAVGQNQHKVTKKYARGRIGSDVYEGLAQVGEEGPELSIDKEGNATILGANGPTYAYVERDDIIFTADETEDILATNPDFNNIPGFRYAHRGLMDSGGAPPSDQGGDENNYNDNVWQGGSGSGSGSGEDDDWEPDRYVVIIEQLADLQREYARLSAAKDRAYGADKIKALDKEIAKTDELIKAQKQYISEIQEYKDKDIQKMKDLGIDVDKEFQFDENGVIRNFDEIEEKYKKAAEKGDQKAMKQFEAIQKYMETNNLLEQEADKLIDLEWQKLDEEMLRIQTKVDIKVAVDDTELNYLQYQLGKINEEAYDVAKALDLVGQSMGTTMNKMGHLRQGIQESIAKGLEGTDLTEDVKKQLEEAIMNGTLTKEMLESMELDENISQTVMDLALNYREQVLQLNEALDSLRQQMVDLVDKYFTNFADKMSQQNQLFNTYGQTLHTYYDLVSLLDRKFDGPMNEMLSKINESLAKQAKDSIKNAEAAVKSAEAKYIEYQRLYNTAIAAGDQDTADKWKAAMDEAYVEMEQANADFANSLLQANQVFLDQFKQGVATAIEDFEKQISPIFGSVENMSAAFERQNNLSSQYVDDYQKYYELNKMTRDLQTSIDETDNINSKKALLKLQDEINKQKNSEKKLSEYDLEVLKNKIELEKARLALDEAKNSKSTVTLSRDQNGNWGYVYTAEEDKVASAEQAYEDKLYQYQESNKKYLDDLQAMAVEAQQSMIDALGALDVNDPNYEANRKNIIDSYMQTIAYIKEQMSSALGNQDSTLDLSMERYSVSSINLKSSFDDLNLSIVTGQTSLEGYFNTIESALPQLLDQLFKLEEVYDQNVADVTQYVAGEKTLADYISENVDLVNTKSDQAVEKIGDIYDEMVSGLKDVNKEIGEIYTTYIVPMNKMIEANERLAESLQQVQKELSDLSEVELPNIEGTIFDHPEGYTENDYGTIKKLTDKEKEILEKLKEEIEVDENGYITNFEELKEKYYQEEPGEGEEDKRDKDKLAIWEMLMDLISWNDYKTESASSRTASFLSKDINAVIASNAAAAQSAASSALAAALTQFESSFEQIVTISAEFPNVVDHNEIQEALNNIINDAAQYANRKY